MNIFVCLILAVFGFLFSLFSPRISWICYGLFKLAWDSNGVVGPVEWWFLAGMIIGTFVNLVLVILLEDD